MSTFVNILIAILIFSIIVIIHELGHFLLAKLNGILVQEFALGMGPKLFSFKKGETTYALKLFPIGGSCMMGEDEDSNDERAFTNKGVWARIAVIFAGPFFNFILAFIMSIILISIAGYDPPIVLGVKDGTAAQTAGLKPGDVITEVDGSNISVGREVATYFMYNELREGEAIEISYERDGVEHTTELIPSVYGRYMLGFSYNSSNEPAIISSLIEGAPLAQAGVLPGDIITAINGTPIKSGNELATYLDTIEMGEEAINISYSRNGVETNIDVIPRYSEELTTGLTYNYQYREDAAPLEVLKYGMVEMKYWIVSTIKGLGRLVTGQAKSDEIGGPVRIVKEIGNVVEESKDDGIKYIILNLMNWCILLSANLGIINLLPLPALDGGRLMFLLLEAVRGKPIDKEKEGKVHLIGFILLMVLMVVVFFNDIRNLFI